MQLQRLLVEMQLHPCFSVNSTICSGHTGPLSGTYDDLHKLLHCSVILYSLWGPMSKKFITQINFWYLLKFNNKKKLLLLFLKQVLLRFVCSLQWSNLHLQFVYLYMPLVWLLLFILLCMCVVSDAQIQNTYIHWHTFQIFHADFLTGVLPAVLR
jgi:hypothetical protein